MQALSAERLSGEELSAFQVIVDFVTNLHNHFEDRIHSIQLYHRLIYQKSFQEVDLIRKHVSLFRTFCRENRRAIREQSVDALTIKRIEFTDRIYIDIPYIMSKVDNETGKIVWEYLLAISAHLDPHDKKDTLALLEKLQSSSTGSEQPQQPQQQLPGGADLLGTMMNNPAITNIMTKIMSNEIDLQKLVSSITPIVENVRKEIEQSDDPTIKNMISMIQSTMTENDEN